MRRELLDFIRSNPIFYGKVGSGYKFKIGKERVIIYITEHFEIENFSSSIYKMKHIYVPLHEEPEFHTWLKLMII